MKPMVKCLICGAVFEAGADVCPVCGAGPDYFVPAEREAPAFRRDTGERFLILGGGTAALSAAEAIRERNATCSIVLVTDEPVPPYNRPMLTKALEEDYGHIAIHGDAWYEEHGIIVLTGRRVESVDASAKLVALSGGLRFQYDKCVYALGARCFIPAIDGAQTPGVVSLRCLEDVRHLRALLLSGKRNAVVIGGGVLGLEAAWALRRHDCAVTVLETGDRVMARQLDAEASRMLSDAAEASGVSIRTRAHAERIEGDSHVTGVRLQGGGRIEADLVVVSSGVRSNCAVAQAAGASVDRAVRVNDRMETSLPDVYACGDCAEFGGVNAALWSVATEMGRVAGANAAGEPVAYSPICPGVTFTGMGTTLYAAGDAGFDPAKSYRIEAKREDSGRRLEKLYYEGGRLVGVILFGDTSRAAEFADLPR